MCEKDEERERRGGLDIEKKKRHPPKRTREKVLLLPGISAEQTVCAFFGSIVTDLLFGF